MRQVNEEMRFYDEGDNMHVQNMLEQPIPVTTNTGYNEFYAEQSESECSSEIKTTEVFDPLLEDKQYLVTMIVECFQQTGEALPTSVEFYRIGNKLGEGAFGKVCIA